MPGAALAVPSEDWVCMPRFQTATWPLGGDYDTYVTEELWQALDRNGNGCLCIMQLRYNASNPTNLVDPPINLVDDRRAP